MWTDIFLITGAYLLGSIPHLAALGRLKKLRLDGDLHINLWERGGSSIGVIGIIIEFVKGVMPVLIGRTMDFSLITVTLAGVAVVIGQMWPIFSKFRGEKGNSIGVAVAAVLAPYPFFVAAVAFAAGAGGKMAPRFLSKERRRQHGFRFTGSPSKSLPLGMAAGFLILPVASWFLREPMIVTCGLSALFILIMIRRLTAGLREDLKTNPSIRNLLVNRLLYDRSVK